MPSIAIAVTHEVLSLVKDGKDYQRRLAIKHRKSSKDVVEALGRASKKKPLQFTFGPGIKLTLVDAGAVYRKHQKGKQLQDFDDLFSLLSRRPGRLFTITW